MKKVTSLFFLFLVFSVGYLLSLPSIQDAEPVFQYVNPPMQDKTYRLDLSRLSITTRTLENYFDKSKIQILEVNDGLKNYSYQESNIEDLENRMILDYENNGSSVKKVEAMLHGIRLLQVHIVTEEQNMKELMDKYPLLEVV